MNFRSLKTPATDLLISLKELDDEVPETWLKPHGILDVFDHCLSEEEVDQTGLATKTPLIDHNLVHEPKFIDFIKKAMLFNGNEEVIIEGEGIDTFSNQGILNYFDILDYRDKIQLLEFVRCSKHSSSDYLATNDAELLQLFLKFATREITFPIFHFQKYRMSLCGNFDLSFPIFFENEEVKAKYSEIAREAGLFIR